MFQVTCFCSLFMLQKCFTKIPFCVMFLQPSVHRSIASPSIGCFCRSFSTDNRCSVRSTHLLKEGPFFDFFPSLLKSCREQIASTIKTYLHWIIFVRIIFSLRTDLFSSMEIQTKIVKVEWIHGTLNIASLEFSIVIREPSCHCSVYLHM